MKRLLILFPLLAMFFCSHAQTTMWIGPSTGSWSDAANWDGGVPTSTSDIIFDGSNPLLSGGAITIADVFQSNPSGSFNSLKVLNNATVKLSGTTDTYFYLFASIEIDTGCVVTVGGTTANRFEIGTTDFTSFINIFGTLDMQGTGNSSNPTIFVPTTITFGPPPPVIVTIRGKVILSGTSAGFISNTTLPVFENGSELIVTRNGGICPKADFQDGSMIKIQGVTTSPTMFNSSAFYEGVIEWDCPGQTIAGSSSIILPSASFNYFDSLVISNTGAAGSVRLATNPSGYYVKNIVMNGGILEFGSPTGSSMYSCRVDNIHQTGGTLIGNAPGVAGFDNAFEQDTINVVNFIQDGGIFEFSNRTPVNAMPNASCVLQVSGNLKVGGTFRLSQPATAPNCALVFNGSSNQNFEVTGLYINKVKTVIENTSILAGVNMLSNVILPDSLVFRQGYIFLNNFNLTNPLPVQAVSNPFQTHAVTNGTGFFVQKSVGAAAVGIPIGASTGTVNPLVIGLFGAGTIDIAAKVEIGVNPPTVFPDIAVDRTWQIMPVDFFMPANLGVSFGYSDLTPLPGDGNVNFSYTSNNEVGMYVGGNWQVVSLPGGIAPSGTNPYAITTVLPSSLFVPNVPSPLVISNVSGVVPVPGIVNFVAKKIAAGALLTWDLAQAAASNNSFEIQRSFDGRGFVSIGRVASGIGILNYSFADNNMAAGLNYYRVKIKDGTGNVKYSDVAALINKSSGIAITSVLPTVVNNTATIMIHSGEKTPVQIHITDMLGRVVKKINSLLNEGSNQLNVDCGSLAKGTYQLIGYSEGNQTNSIRFVKD